MKNEIIIYQADELTSRIDVRVEDETVWLNLNQITELFDRDKSVISRHITNVFKEGELEKYLVVAKYATTAKDGKIYQVEYYNLDVIISVGYRVKSKQGTQFRIWANSVLKDYLLKGYSLNNRINRLEDHIFDLKEKVNKIDLQLSTDDIPRQGIFFAGQVFDAHVFVSDLFSRVNKSIVIIDNYIDVTIIAYLSQLPKNTKVKIITKSISTKLKLDLEKFANQHFPVEVIIFKQSHDRFIIIDDKEVYHIGASLKDLGKKLFGFSKMDKTSLNVLSLMVEV